MNPQAAKELFDSQVEALERAAELRGWNIYDRNFPVLDVGFCREGRTELRIRLRAPNWNDDPPSVELLNADGTYLGVGKVPAHGFFNANAHPATGRPFVCSPGALEYHTHESHTADRWENYKARFTLGEILTRAHNAWLDAK